MEETGFIGRESFKLKFEDLSEVAYGAVIANKIADIDAQESVNVQISLLDLFPRYDTLEKLQAEIAGRKGLLKNRNTEYMVDMMNFMFKTDFGSSETEIDLVTFYNGRIAQSLDYLQKGDSVGLIPCIESYQVDETNPLHTFAIEVIPCKFMQVQKENVYAHITLHEKMFSQFQTKTEEVGTFISYRKQVEFAHQYFDERQKKTGETTFEFNLKEIPFRHLVSSVEDGENRFTLPAPLTCGPAERIILPFLLETLGRLDINNFKVGSSPLYINDIELLYSVSKPAIKNKFTAKYFGLSPEMRRKLNETQLEIFERSYRYLNENASFIGRPKIEVQFCDVFFWLLRKVTYCLEEPSFLKEKSEAWLNANSNGRYTQMEDNFFLPFLHERLKDEFGDLVQKKPEKFGGEIDLLFSELPIELKVRRNQTQSLAEIIDEKYKPASQASTYAATTRLGFVAVLDLPDTKKQITNLDHCIHVIEKDFGDDSFKTLIVVCIFYCNLPMPSSAS